MSDGEVFRDWDAEFSEILKEKITGRDLDRMYAGAYTSYTRDNALRLSVSEMTETIFAFVSGTIGAEDAEEGYNAILESVVGIVRAVEASQAEG
jgi:hypothetical protein